MQAVVNDGAEGVEVHGGWGKEGWDRDSSPKVLLLDKVAVRLTVERAQGQSYSFSPRETMNECHLVGGKPSMMSFCSTLNECFHQAVRDVQKSNSSWPCPRTTFVQKRRYFSLCLLQTRNFRSWATKRSAVFLLYGIRLPLYLGKNYDNGKYLPLFFWTRI